MAHQSWSCDRQLGTLTCNSGGKGPLKTINRRIRALSVGGDMGTKWAQLVAYDTPPLIGCQGVRGRPLRLEAR